MELTNEEKSDIVTQHIKSVVSNIYNLYVSLIAEQAVETINQANVDNLNQQIDNETSKKEALLSELATLQA
jgi:hypothetical protein